MLSSLTLRVTELFEFAWRPDVHLTSAASRDLEDPANCFTTANGRFAAYKNRLLCEPFHTSGAHGGVEFV
jgi:hypothetical protein